MGPQRRLRELEPRVAAVCEVLVRMGLAADWPPIHLRATASLYVRAAALGGAPAPDQ